jgi:hypothetical protein
MRPNLGVGLCDVISRGLCCVYTFYCSLSTVFLQKMGGRISFLCYICTLVQQCELAIIFAFHIISLPKVVGFVYVVGFDTLTFQQHRRRLRLS